MRMKEAKGVFEYISRVETVVNKLGRNGDTAYLLSGAENLKVIN